MKSDASRPHSSSTFVQTHVKGPARQVQTSAILVLSAICLLLLWETKSHKQTSHPKVNVKQKGQAKKNKTQPVKQSFLKISILERVDLKICW